MRKYFPILLAAMSIGVNLFAPQNWIEQNYTRGLYVIVRDVFDHTLYFLPFASLYLLVIVLLYLIFRFFHPLFQKIVPLKKRLLNALSSLGIFLGYAVTAFYFLWGFNYARISFKKQMDLTLTVPDSTQLKNELILSAQETETALTNFKNGGQILENKNLEDTVRAALFETMRKLNLPITGTPRGREIKPDGSMFRFGISGIYIPFVGEANMDAANYVLEKPFTLAHEMAHGLGWTDEGTCNFIAYLTCTQSSNSFLKYSGYISYYRYIAPTYRRINNEDYKKFRETLSPDLKKDLDAIQKAILKYPLWLSSDGLNDVFLKSQGVKAGINSYNQVVLLVRAWREKGR